MNQAVVTRLLSEPTLLKGITYATHKAVVSNYCLWFALTNETWELGGAYEPFRARDFRHYLQVIGAI